MRGERDEEGGEGDEGGEGGRKEREWGRGVVECREVGTGEGVCGG